MDTDTIRCAIEIGSDASLVFFRWLALAAEPAPEVVRVDAQGSRSRWNVQPQEDTMALEFLNDASGLGKRIVAQKINDRRHEFESRIRVVELPILERQRTAT